MQTTQSIRSGLALAVFVSSLLSACRSNATSAPKYLGSEAEYFTPSARVYFDTGRDEDDEVDLYKDGSFSPAVDFLGISFPFIVRESTLSTGKALAAAEFATASKNGPEVDFASEVEAKRSQLERARIEIAEVHKNSADSGSKARLLGLEQSEAKAALELVAAQEKLAANEVLHKQREEIKTETTKDATREGGRRLSGDWILAPRVAIGLTAPAGDSEDGSMEASGAPVLYVSAGLAFDLYKGDRKPNSMDGVGVRVEAGWMYGVTADEDIGDADDLAFYVGLSVFLD